MLAAAALLAGCTGGDDEDPIDMERYQQALAEPGETFTPDEMSGGTDFHVRLLTPLDRENMGTGDHPLEFLLYDATEDVPIIDAEIPLDARDHTWMPNHGHFCGPTDQPQSDDGGVYEGQFHLSMPGLCEVTLAGERPNGDSFELVIAFTVPED